jgi:hypothetical protein
MKKDLQPIYFGILFSFLYLQMYKIISSLLITPILSMYLNIYLIPIILGIFIVLLSLWFYHLKVFPKIKIGIILLVICLSIIVKLFEWLPYYISKCSYTNEEKYLVLNLTSYCSTINTVAFIVLAYFKYIKMKKE